MGLQVTGKVIRWILSKILFSGNWTASFLIEKPALHFRKALPIFRVFPYLFLGQFLKV